MTIWFLITLCLSYLCLRVQSSAQSCCQTKAEGKELKRVLSEIELPPTSSKRDTPAIVNVSLHIETMRNIASEVTLDFYIIQKWQDARLALKLGGELNESILISGRGRPEPMWYPDTYFLLVHSLLYSHEEQSVELQPDNYIEHIRKVRLITPCTPNVLLFPFDFVNCTLQLSSFGFNVLDVSYQWDVVRTPNAVYVDPLNNDADHLGFQILPTKHLQYKCIYGPYEFSCLKAVVSLKRSFSIYLLQIYVPATLLVVLSWLTFWVNIKATPARASLSVTTVLSILTLATRSAAQNEKHVNGKVTSLDIYVYVCFIFVILAMLEFSLSDFVACNESSEPQKQLNGSAATYRLATFSRRFFKDGDHVNRIARVLLPVSFLAFNFVYWTVLTVAVWSQ